MDVLGQFIDDRDEEANAEALARSKSHRSASSDRATIEWLSGNRSPEERLISFDSWLRRQLEERFVWPLAEAKKKKLIEQCRIELERLILELWKRGWYLDGKRLAAHLQRVLDSISKYQKAGKVEDFWSYFKSSVNRYVGVNAEEIQTEAMRAGAHVGQVLSAMGISTKAEITLPELIAQRRNEISEEKTLRQKLAVARKLSKHAGDTPSLFDER